MRASARQVSQRNAATANGGDGMDTWRQQAQDLSHDLLTRLGWSLGWRPSAPLWQKGLSSLVIAVAVRTFIGAATFMHQGWSKRRRSGGGRKARRREGGGGGGVHSVRSVRSAVGDAMVWLRHLAAVPARLAVDLWWRAAAAAATAAAAAAAMARAIHASLVRRVRAALALPVVLLRRLRACVRWPALRRAPAPAPPTTTTTSEASWRQSEEGNECVVCMDAAKEAVLIPCYHL